MFTKRISQMSDVLEDLVAVARASDACIALKTLSDSYALEESFDDAHASTYAITDEIDALDAFVIGTIGDDVFGDVVAINFDSETGFCVASVVSVDDRAQQMKIVSVDGVNRAMLMLDDTLLMPRPGATHWRTHDGRGVVALGESARVLAVLLGDMAVAIKSVSEDDYEYYPDFVIAEQKRERMH